ncbi:hypothetical protein A1O7_02140 [Cladophialophora yegresii CBS 114405]|uniref:Uncharacterized protein n=1 Tax=Cladophialophora yegresii CBS 114405 TaxID=1182544 RepID=W9WAZ6_9EURO|nr:uncharacterized protein A1O7_02140 [Cladophialophora yegresii CBS 114405]EXJ61711.1 hypothetical protein A1O7_02140 [Cladophialophora yegresii CBS 114405]
MLKMIQPALPDLAAIPLKRTKSSSFNKADTKSQPMVTHKDKTVVASPDGSPAYPQKSSSSTASSSTPRPSRRSTRPNHGTISRLPSPDVEKANGSSHTTNSPDSAFHKNMQSAGFTIVRRRSTQSAPAPQPKQNLQEKRAQAPDHTTGSGSRYNVLLIEELGLDAEDVVSEGTGSDTSPLPVIEPNNTTATTTNKKKNRKTKKPKKRRADIKAPEGLCVAVASDRHDKASGPSTAVPHQEQNAIEEDEGEEKKDERAKGLINTITRPEYLFLILWVVLAEIARRVFDVQIGQG